MDQLLRMDNVEKASASHHRRSIRLSRFDYTSDGAYFVSVCTHQRTCLFGKVLDGIMVLDSPGRIVHDVWRELPHHYAHVDLDAFVVMPNHIHGIILLSSGPVNFRIGLTKLQPLSEIVRAFKTFSSRRVNMWRRMSGTPLWQRNYYEHIVRDEDDLERLRRYIADNAARWSEDHENPFRRS